MEHGEQSRACQDSLARHLRRLRLKDLHPKWKKPEDVRQAQPPVEPIRCVEVYLANRLGLSTTLVVLPLEAPGISNEDTHDVVGNGLF